MAKKKEVKEENEWPKNEVCPCGSGKLYKENITKL